MIGGVFAPERLEIGVSGSQIDIGVVALCYRKLTGSIGIHAF